MSVAESTREKALKALDGMAEIVRKERLVRGDYVSKDFDLTMSTAICQGHRYCAIGSLWAGAGVKVKRHTWHVELPGVYEDDRVEFMARRPGLRLAYAELNAAAERYAKRHRISLNDAEDDEHFAAPAEALFEQRKQVGRPELLRIIASARRQVKAAA